MRTWRCRPTTSMGRRNSNAEHSVLRPASRTTVGGVSVSTATIRPSLPWRPLYARYPARSCRSANGHEPPFAGFPIHAPILWATAQRRVGSGRRSLATRALSRSKWPRSRSRKTCYRDSPNNRLNCCLSRSHRPGRRRQAFTRGATMCGCRTCEPSTCASIAATWRPRSSRGGNHDAVLGVAAESRR